MSDYLLGVDVSSHQANWAGLASNEYYGWVKATEGTSYVNPEHDDQVAKIRAAGKQVGHYHWLVKGKTQDQVDYFFSKANVQPGDMIALDWEDSSRPPNDEKDAWIRSAQAKVDGSSKVGLYCNRDWWLNMDTTSFYGDYLWIANYTSASDPGIEADWTFWQYTSTPYDKNRGKFASLSALQDWAGSEQTNPPEPPSTDGLWYSTDYLFTKITPDPTNPGKIKNGDKVKVTASGSLKARTLPGGPQSLDKNGDPLARANGYQFDVTGDLVDGWVTGGTNWYSSDYLAVVTAPPPPSKPAWKTTPYRVLPLKDVTDTCSYLQAGVRVAANGGLPDYWIIAQDYNNSGNTRFGRVSSSGTLIDGMTVKNGGHGQTFHAYTSAAGNLYIWTLIGDYAYRIKWQPGKSVTASSSGVEKMAYGKARPVGTYESYIGFRSASDTQETMTIHNRFGFTDPANNSADPIHKITIKKRTDYTQQSWAVSKDRIYRIYGKTNETPGSGSGKHVFDVLDWNGKLLVDRLDIRTMYQKGCTENEPEGITFSGAPGSILAGMREGPASPPKRSYIWWEMTGLP